MATVRKTNPVPSITLEDLDHALAKQFGHLEESFQKIIEKTHTEKLDKMIEVMLVMQMEFRQVSKKLERSSKSPTPVELHDEVKKDEQGAIDCPPSAIGTQVDTIAGYGSVGGLRHSKKPSRLSLLNPFKSSNAKLNTADDLEEPSRPSSTSVSKSMPHDPNTEKNMASKRALKIQCECESVEAGDSSDGSRILPTHVASAPLLAKEKTGGSAQEDFLINSLNLLRSPAFEGVVVCLVLMNSLWIGVELEYRLSVSDIRPPLFNVIDIAFCSIFSAELLLRLSLLREGFFDPREVGVTWNYFDFLLVLSQIVEIACRYVDIKGHNLNVSWLRILRVLRIIRLTRIVRAVRFVEGLRTLMRCVVRGMTATIWIALFLGMQIYTCSLALTEVVHEERAKAEALGAEADLERLFGTLVRTMGTLCESITGGIDWDHALVPLMELSSCLGIAFGFYVTFSTFVILNIFTGFFVNTSSTCAEEDNKTNLRDRVADALVQDQHKVNKKLFLERIQSSEMQTYLQTIDLHPDEAEGLFKLLDLDDRDDLDPIECVTALMRMQGSAKAFDLRLLTFMFAKAQEWNVEHMTLLQKNVDDLHSIIAEMPLGNN